MRSWAFRGGTWSSRLVCASILIGCVAGEAPVALEGRGAPAAPDAGSESLYPEVEAIIARSCTFERCHAGVIVGAGLLLLPDGDFHAAMVGVEACEYDRMKIVEPGDPDASWLMVKLTAPFRPADDPYANYIYFDPPSDWDPLVRGCQDETDAGEPLFGHRMPDTAPNQLPEQELRLIEAWISQGAPR